MVTMVEKEQNQRWLGLEVISGFGRFASIVSELGGFGGGGHPKQSH